MRNKGRRKSADSKSPDSGPVFRAGRIAAAVEEELDLHGLAIDEAMALVELAFARWRNRPGACIRVIHGKSSGSRDSIKGMLKHNLETRWKGKVDSYRQEPANPGATLIYPA